nr:hypothetical protein [Tanacetum cinerariifolium]
MADMNINAPASQAPAMAPPVRTDDQILPCIRWVPIGKSNCYLDLEKSQSNPIYKIAVDLLKHTNFFKAFTASSTIPSIYIQQFWDMVQYDKKAGCYRCQLDEQWFVLTKDTLREALQITHEEFTQSIHTFIEDKRNMSQHTTGKKKATLIVIPSIRFTKLIIHHLQRRHKFHPRPDSLLHLPNEEPVLGYLKKPKSTAPKAPPRPSVLTPVTSAQPAPTSAPAKPQEKKRKQTIETTDKPPKAKKSKYGFIGKKRTLKSVAASVAGDAPAKEPQVAAKDADLQKALEESMKIMYVVPRGSLPPVVIREPESGKYQPLPVVPGKGKAKVTEEQVAHDLLSLQKPKKKSLVDQYIFQRHTSIPTRSSEHDEPSYDELERSESEESKKVVPGADEGAQGQGQGEGQAGPDPGAQAEGQTGSDADLGYTGADIQSIPSPMVHARPDREHMDLDVADVSPQPFTEQLDEGFTTTAYPKVQENLKLTVEEQVLLKEPASSSGTLSSLQHLSKDISFRDLFFSDKPSEADNDKATVETKVESMVSVTIQQDMSSIPPMTSPIINLTSRPESPKVHRTAEAMMVKRIGELEHIMANLIQENKGLKERLDSHRACLYTLEQLDIPHQVSKAVSEVVMKAAVDWAMQAPLRNRFRDLPKADMKEILHQRMWETESYKSHEDYMQLYEALEKSMNSDHSQELVQDLAEVRKKNKKSRESPKTPPGSPPHQPPPPPPPAGPFGTSGAPGASGSSQVPPPPPSPSSTNQKNLEMDEDIGPDEQAQSTDDEDIRSAHIPKVNLRQDWWKPLEEERPATPEPDWSIPSSNAPSQRITGHQLWRPTIHLLLKTRYSRRPYQMKECHKLLTDNVDEPILRHNVSKPLPLGGPPGQVTIQSDFFFNKDLDYLRYDSKASRPALSISKMKAAYYPDIGLEQMVPDQFWIEKECKYDITAMYGISYWLFQIQRFYIDRHTSEGDRSAVRTHIRILSVVRIKVFSMYGVKEFKINRMNPGLNTRFFDQEGCGSEQGVHVRHSKAIEDKEDLSQPGELIPTDAAAGQRDVNSQLHAHTSISLSMTRWQLKDLQHKFRNSNGCCYVQEKCGHADPNVTTSQDGNPPQQG